MSQGTRDDVRWWIGTSGFSYDFWKGSFYPERISGSAMLAYYAERLPTVEINNTFYRMPKRSVLEGWHGATPDDFRFVLKAPRRITHQAKLVDVGDSVSYLYAQAEGLGEKLGPVLFQLPPFVKKDVALLDAFLATLPKDAHPVLEVRSRSWYEDDVLDRLRERGMALCVTDEVEDRMAPLVATTSFAYVRLRLDAYGDAELTSWIDRLRALRVKEAYVFFKHEEEGASPKLALRMLELTREAK